VLLSLASIEDGLKERFGELAAKHPVHFGACIPRASNRHEAERLAGSIRRSLDCRLPPSFVDAMATWDLGHCEIAGILFGRSSRYDEQVAEYNAPKPGIRWWEDTNVDSRPPDLIMVASSDPWILLLHCVTGQVLAYDCEAGSPTARPIASDFTHLLRGLATVELASGNQASSQALFESVASSVGQPESVWFWRCLRRADDA
jgi:hypothetical protein